MDTSTQTLGQQRVRASFNPDANSDVDIIKTKAAELIDLAMTFAGKDGRLASLAATAFEEGAMWAVKAATAAAPAAAPTNAVIAAPAKE